MKETWLILGGTSTIARAFARAVATEGASVVLAGRDMAELERSAKDLAAGHGFSARALAFDARDLASHAGVAAEMAKSDGILNVGWFIGSMPEQAAIDADPALAEGVLADSFGGAVSILQHLAPVLEAQRGGAVLALGSVAGDRGRLKNYVYGAAKAGLATYLSGLRNRLGRSGVHVVTVKPGFIDTAMTWDAEGMFLVASPEDAARDCLGAVRKKRDVIYTPWFWRWIMLIIRTIPERVFKKLSI
jgi:short-subunit dehydrogenase